MKERKAKEGDVAALRGVAEFLPKFKAEGFQFGHWTQPSTDEDGRTRFPYFALSDEAEAFVRAAYDLGWVRTDFDWPAWSETIEAVKLRDDPDSLAQASQEHLASLLTVCIRQDRFVEGALMSAFESGLLVRILERASAILAGRTR